MRAMASLAAVRCLAFLIVACMSVTMVVGEAQFTGIAGSRVCTVAGGCPLQLNGRGFSNTLPLPTEADSKIGNRVYLRDGVKHTECDVDHYRSNEGRLVCVTRPGDPGTYDVIVEVDGNEIPRCGNWRCRYEYRWNWRTWLTSTYTISGAYNTSYTTAYGRFYTITFDDLQRSEDDDPTSQTIEKILWGPSRCSPRNFYTGEIYRLQWHNEDSKTWAYIGCAPETDVPGSYPLRLYLGVNGSPRIEPSTYWVDGQDRLYHYQQHAEITGISPVSGSLAGGTLVTITGTGFFKIDYVYVAGTPCEVQSVSPNEIKCYTGSAPDETNVYPGNRGLLREFWINQNDFTFREVSQFEDLSWNTSDPKYRLLGVIPNAGSTEEPAEAPDNFASRLTGYFVPPYDGEYTFFIRTDDYGELLLSNSSSPDGLVSIASVPRYTRHYTTFDEQTSAKLVLERGKYYYLEARHFDRGSASRVELGVGFHKTKWNHTSVDKVVNEVQRIEKHAASQNETQTVLLGGKNEVQTISINYTVCQSENCTVSGTFIVTYDGQSTELTLLDSPATLQSALNSLSSVQSDVTVTLDDVDDGVDTFTVTFPNYENVQDIDVTYTGNESISIQVAVETDGAPSIAPSSFRFSYAGVESTIDLSLSSTAQEVTDALVDLFSVKCSPSISMRGFTFFQDYEDNGYGDRVRDTEPYCGRTSVKNPASLFVQDASPSSIQGTNSQEFFVKNSRYLCFAYRGLGFEGSMRMVLERYQKIDNEQVNDRDVNFNIFEDGQTPSESWRHGCVNLYHIISDEVPEDPEDYILKVSHIHIYHSNTNDNDFYVDQVSIGSSETMPASLRLPAARPNGIFVEDVTVTSVAQGFAITMVGANCGFNYSALEFVNATNQLELDDSVTYTNSLWPDGAVIIVQRTARATPPVMGSFDLGFNDRTAYDIPADASEAELEQKLQNDLLTGSVRVTRSGSCSAYMWEVEFTEKGESQPLLTVARNGVTNNQSPVNITVTKVKDGHLFMAPIPGEFLRSAHSEPQVVLSANRIPASCREDCSFTYSSEATPTLLSITPSSGSAGTSITLTGTLFSAVTNENTVTINGVVCTITSSSATQISCDVGESAAGEFNVLVRVSGRGYASTPSGPIMFNYTISATSVSPSVGSAAGGTVITINGSGFGDEVTVTVAGQSCVILSSSFNQLKCQVEVQPSSNRKKRSMDTAVIITAPAGQSASLDNAFLLDGGMTPTITAVSPESSGVSGGELLTITGTQFGSSVALVTIGGNDCPVVSHTDTEITCTLPGNQPGQYMVKVLIDNIGLASGSASITYNLQVTGIFPNHGSLAGGTKLSITGGGFGTNAENVSVWLGGRECQVTSVVDDLVTCVTSGLSVNHVVDHLGKDLMYGLGYQWNPVRLDITAGDSVTWTWATPQYVTGIQYSVHQTANVDSTIYDGTGFNSGPPTPTGSFTHKFEAPGTYYYSSDAVNGIDATDVIYMRGYVVVAPRLSSAESLVLTFGEYEAAQNTTSGTSAPSDTSPCPGNTDLISGCVDTQPVGNDADKFSYSYYTCSTPTVTSISPNIGTSDVTINITGTGFSDTACQNEVTVSGYPCEVQSATNTEILCIVNTQNSLQVAVRHPVAVTVNNRGSATILPTELIKRSFVLQPRIDGVSIRSGSVIGGTRLLLNGDGFAEPAVRIGGVPCNVMFSNYTHILCSTGENHEGTYDLSVSVSNLESEWTTPRNFTYTNDSTPLVDEFSPGIVSGPSTTLTFAGFFGFDSNSADITVTIGESECTVTFSNVTHLSCDVGYVLVGTRTVTLHVAIMGDAHFKVPASVWSSKHTSGVSPSVGSTEGGQLITISGNGFVEDETTVTIDNQPCPIQSLNISTITCITPPRSAGTRNIQVISDGNSYTPQSYEYSTSETPEVASVSPTQGGIGDTITITGSGFSDQASDLTVTLDGNECAVTAASDTSVSCTTGAHSAGTYDVKVHVSGKGYASGDATFEYVLSVTSANPNEGSFGGGRLLTITGAGFDESTTVVTVCDNVCPIESVTNTQITCEVPINFGEGSSLECQIRVQLQNGPTINASDTFTYRRSLTPVITGVSPVRGGTGGGTTLTINGTDFLASGNNVTIAGTVCEVMSESSTQIVCVTRAHSPTEMSKVRVDVGASGVAFAAEGVADFFYIDVWSSRFTWGGGDPPEEGTFVIISAGQTVLLDVDTPVLKVLLIEGGSLIFDEKDVELNAEYIIITDGGHLEIGTEEKPFEHKAIITMYGNVRSTELPLFGAKTLAVRNGTVDMHGKHIPIMWTHLAETIEPGDNVLSLKQAVNWQVGDEIVIASTGDRHKQTQNEQVTITAVSSDGLTLTFDPAVKYQHISIVQEIDGVVLETRGEVGLLTHNVKMRGNVNTDWTETIDACEKEFDTGMFETQTCFLGRFGEETASDQFGSQIMFFAKEKDAHLVQGRIEYVEFTHAGQAFRLGRYPIHFHLNGNVTGSYVRGCSVHHTFNRAVTIHGVHGLLVEHNVAFNVMGHAFFLEDGIETNNIIQYNLAVFVRPSSSLLNVDVTPASFWVTNPDNIVRHNAAAGGSHFGFWYNMPQHPGGPSFTTSVCPRNVPLLEFYNNTAHTMGWYGLWVFPSYSPKVGGGCNSQESVPAEYRNLTVWHTERGAEAVLVGAVQFHNFLAADNVESGYEYQQINGAPWGAEGALIKDSVVIGRSDGLSGDAENASCTISGVRTPHTRYLTVDGVKFINFDRPMCAAVKACSKCRAFQGGFPSRYQNLEFYNSPNKAGFQWHHEAWFEDLDGTFTGNAGSSVLPANDNLPPDHCQINVTEYNFGVHPGAVCDDTVHFHRLAFNNPKPDSLLFKDALFTNAHGTTVNIYRKKRLTHAKGWMLTLIDGDSYTFFFRDRDHLTNITYNSRFYDFKEGDFVLITHNFTQKPDRASIIGSDRNSSESVPTYVDNLNGDYYINNDTNDLTYIVSGVGHQDPTDFNVSPNIYRCFYLDCIPPVPEPPPSSRPEDALLWSDPAAWEGVDEGYGGHGGGVPQDGDDVQILPGLYIVANDTLPRMNKLYIYGTLELDDIRDYTLNATYILIQGGRLIIGANDSMPFRHNVRIVLNGDHNTEDIPLPNGPNLGAKALGVFGTLDLHGVQRSVTWTQLASTVVPGENTITVEAETDWAVNDEIAVATTDFESWHTETFTIAEVLSASSFRLNGTFAYKHTAETSTLSDGSFSYKIAAEVGLLTRNIVVEGADYDMLFQESFGARLLVGRFFQDGELYKGSAYISNVQFKHTGQEGYTEPYDPRYSLAFLDLGDEQDDPLGRPASYVTGSSFHNGFSPAIGVFGSDGVLVKDNVVHHVVGEGIVIQSRDVRLIHNLVMLSIAPATYQDRNEVESLLWDGAIEIEEADDLIMIDNTVAGSERVGYKMKGEVCDGTSDWSGNTVHSALQGIMLFKKSQKGCSMVANFYAYRNFQYGVNMQVSSGMFLTNLTLVDNKNGILPMPFKPPALSHIKEDKLFELTNSVLIGTSGSFDCATDDVRPEVASFPKVRIHNAQLPPEGGVVGYIFTSFMSKTNGAPFFPFQGIMSYPAIGGVTRISGVTFANYNDHCGRRGRAIMTNLQSEDLQHPIQTSQIHLVDTNTQSLVYYHRPPLGKVNPSDCVDMDCDGLKKALIRDLDGSMLGSVGTIIPDSAFEWDGDPRRGLGDYRIPRTLLTDPRDGSRLDVRVKAPNKGIIGAGSNNCTWMEIWQAYKCHNYDHMMMVIESMDADTEVRRLSPVALWADGWVDLINGPQDHGWCLGYTCQERISTFYSIVATGKEYELYFTGTNPQGMRLHLLNADDSQALVVGIWYANPQQLDVYSNDVYIYPNNADFSNGDLVLRRPSLQNPDQFKPSPSSLINGENYFERDTQTLYVVLRGSNRLEIKTTPVVIVSFGVPAVSIDDFFEQNLRENLAGLLGISSDKIRIVDIISESSGRRRKRAAPGEMEVVIEIGNAASNATNATDTTATAAPGDGDLSVDDLVGLQTQLANEFQEGTLGDSLNITISSVEMTDPVPPPVDPTGGVRATNETGGPSNGTTTYAEQQAMEEAMVAAEQGQPVVYTTPSNLVIVSEPSEGNEFSSFPMQPRIKVVDAQGVLVTALGHVSNPWRLTASIVTGTGNNAGRLLGNVTVPFQGGWANFTGLHIDLAGSGYILDFTISYPNQSPLAAVRTSAFTVAARQLTAIQVSPAVTAYEGVAFQVVIEVRDNMTRQPVTNLDQTGSSNWRASASLYMSSNYRGQLSGQTNVPIDLVTGRATFNLSINTNGYGYILSINIAPDQVSIYSFVTQLQPFDVMSPGSVPHTGTPVEVAVRFPNDYDMYVAGKETNFITNFRNKVAYRYTNVTISNVRVERGSIILRFDMTGDTDGTVQRLYDDARNGDIVVTFEGNRLTADPFLLVDGQEYTETAPPAPFPVWAIIVVVIVGILLLAVVIIFVFYKCHRKERKVAGDVLPLAEVRSLQNRSFAQITSESRSESKTSLIKPDTPTLIIDEDLDETPRGKPFNKQLLINEERASMRSNRSNSPRLTPEVAVTALPPGFTEGQIETDIEDRYPMPINIKNADGTFQKIGMVSANLVGTLSHLRLDIKKDQALPPKLREKPFVFLNPVDLTDYETPQEKRVSVNEVYGSTNIVLIRWHDEQDTHDICVCGLVGQFKCSLCQRQSYCSPQCQSTDWPRHTFSCSEWCKELKDKDLLEAAQNPAMY